MSSPSAALKSDASMVQGRPLSGEANEKAALGGLRAMHIGANGNSSHATAGMGETATKQSNKHNNAGKEAHMHFTFVSDYIFKIHE